MCVKKAVYFYVMLSMRLARICWVMAAGVLSFSLKTDSMTESSVEVVSCPVKAHQSFTTMPGKKQFVQFYYTQGSGSGSGFNRVSGSGSGSWRAKMTHKSRIFF
jgi:hypothetical protein